MSETYGKATTFYRNGKTFIYYGNDPINRKEIQAITGKSQQTICRWVSSGQLPAVRGKKRSWLVNPADLEKFMAKHKFRKSGGGL